MINQNDGNDTNKDFLNFDQPFGNNFPLSAKNKPNSFGSPMDLLKKVPSQHYMMNDAPQSQISNAVIRKPRMVSTQIPTT